MNKAATLGLTAVLTSTQGLPSYVVNHPFADNETAAQFGSKAINNGYVHHEEQRCGRDYVKFKIEVELPFPKPPAYRKFSVTGPDCAPDRRAIIEKELAALPSGAFKKVRYRTVFKFNLIAKLAE